MKPIRLWKYIGDTPFYVGVEGESQQIIIRRIFSKRGDSLQVQLLPNALPVSIHRAVTDKNPVGYFMGGKSFGNIADGLELALGEMCFRPLFFAGFVQGVKEGIGQLGADVL